MIVYHGSTDIIKNPDVIHSKKYLDFGKGFYLTSFENQAKRWAFRKGMRQEKPGIVNIYELSEDWSKFRILSFEKEDEKWLEMNNQICIANQDTLDKVLTFQKAYEVEQNGK